MKSVICIERSIADNNEKDIIKRPKHDKLANLSWLLFNTDPTQGPTAKHHKLAEIPL